MNIVETLKQKIDFIDLVSNYTKLTKKGKNFMGLCPFHEEKTPSFSVDPERQLYHCFGCEKGGDMISFIMEVENLSFNEAIDFLSKKYNLKLPRYSKKTSKMENEILKLNKQICEYYHKVLNTERGKKALDHLKTRGINEEIINEFKIGYSIPLSESEVLRNIIKKTPTGILQRSGNFIIKDNNKIYSRFNNRVMIPIINLSGKILGFGGRALNEEQPKYINSPQTPLYKKSFELFGLNLSKNYIREEEEAILVEGYFDMISLYKYGIKNVVASLGTSLTRNQVFLLKKFTDKVVIFYDFDDAGINAIKRSFSHFIDANIFVEVFNGEKGLDPEDFINKHGENYFKNKKKKSINPVYFYIGSKKIIDPVKKRKKLNDLFSILSKTDDPIFLDEYLKKVSTLFDIDLQRLKDIFSREKKKFNKFDNRDRKIKDLKTDIELFEKIIISFMFKAPPSTLKNYSYYLKEIYFPIFKYPNLIRTILKLKYSSDNFEKQIKEFLPKEELNFLYSLIFKGKKDYTENDFIASLKELKIKYLKNKLKEINNQLEENFSNHDKIKELLNKKISILNQIDNIPNNEEVIYE